LTDHNQDEKGEVTMQTFEQEQQQKENSKDKCYNAHKQKLRRRYLKKQRSKQRPSLREERNHVSELDNSFELMTFAFKGLSLL
jgi:hypothetical protein